jgi:hypothetical protein
MRANKDRAKAAGLGRARWLSRRQCQRFLGVGPLLVALLIAPAIWPATQCADGATIPPQPVNTAKPALNNTAPAQAGSLSVSNGSWANTPVSFHYQWRDCNKSGAECVAISGATMSRYIPGAGDVGKTLSALVLARNAGGEGYAASEASAAVAPATPVNTTPPTMTPVAPQRGVTETADVGSWTFSPSSYSYQWQDCNAGGEECTNIAGATSATYTPLPVDVGAMLTVVVTATNSGANGTASSGNSGRLVLSTTPEPFYARTLGTAFSAPGSVWNTSQEANTETDPTSTTLVETVSRWGAHNMNGISTTSYSSPIYTVPANQPTSKVVLDWSSPPLNTALQAVPIPVGATTAKGSDEQMVVYQPSSHQLWEFWHMREGLLPPTTASFTATTSSGGKLAVGTYYYSVTALSAAGETTPSEAFQVNVTQSDSVVSLSFKGVIYGQSYKVYRGTEPGNMGYIGTLKQSTNIYGTTVTYPDKGSVTPSGAPPSVNTATTPGQWHAGWAGHIANVSSDPGYYRLLRSGSGVVTEEPGWGATASSLPIADGLITIGDLEQGSIDHAMQLLVPTARAGAHAYPAERSDGGEISAASIPEGAHFVLSKSVNCAEQVTSFMRIVCVAAQRYGFIVNDQTGGGMALRAEDPTPLMQAGGVNPYPRYFTNAEGKLLQPYQMMAAFPWTSLRLLPMKLETPSEYHS